jgi:GDP-L-fucose synthase
MSDWFETPLDLTGKRVWVAGDRGMVGSRLSRRLQRERCEILQSPHDLDLRDQFETQRWMAENKPQMIIMAAAKVGGILANQNAPAEFLYDNLTMAANVIHGAYETGVERLLYLGSSCIYPKLAAQPITEGALLEGALEPTNEAYALAKIAGIKLCETYRAQYGCDFISAMPCNLYGPGDRFDAQISHVIPALMLRAHEAKISGMRELTIWGSGKALREFLYVDDAADGLVFLLQNYCGAGLINLGSGIEISIADLARMICETVGFQGALTLDKTKPDGAPRKLLDVSRMGGQGWQAQTPLAQGLAQTYEYYLQHRERYAHAA